MSAVLEAAERLQYAARHGAPCAPVRELIGADDVAAAYAVQEELTRARIAAGGVVVGRKVGLTSPAVQAQLGVDRPDFGVLFADMRDDDGAAVSTAGLLQPRIEAEVAFVLRADLPADWSDGPLDEPVDVARVRAAVAQVLPALEVVDSRIDGWDIRFGDTVADNGSSARFVTGGPARTLADVEPREVTMTLRRSRAAAGDRAEGEVVSSGSGAACLGDPLLALAWLARAARDLGRPLQAGEVVLSGALGPMVPVAAGATYHAEISGLGAVSVHFTEDV